MTVPRRPIPSSPTRCSPEEVPVLVLHNVDPAWSAQELRDVLGQVGFLIKALEEQGHLVEELRVKNPMLAMGLAGWDPRELVVLNWCEGIPGLDRSEPLVPLTLEALGFIYTGSRAEVLSLSWDKASVKRILDREGISTPKWNLYRSPNVEDWDTFPAIVKSARDHCSLGLSPSSVVLDRKELLEQVHRVIQEMGQPALVEDFIDGPEFHVNLWGNGVVELLPPAEMDFGAFQDVRERLCTFDSKFSPGSRHYEGIQVRVPGRLSEKQRGELEALAVRAYRAIGCRDYARLDVRGREGVFYVLDVNPNPDIGSDTSMALCAEKAGYSYGGMLSRIVGFAAARHPVFGKHLSIGRARRRSGLLRAGMPR
ncbi:MAG: D-alanine--D-alanine ligase family protein [Thermodesulfobacteriota bacterium]